MKALFALAFVSLAFAQAWAGACIDERDLGKLREAEARLERRLERLLKTRRNASDWARIAASAEVTRQTSLRVGGVTPARQVSALAVNPTAIDRLHEMASPRIQVAYRDYARESEALIYECVR